jgi:hypothetical protein
MNRSFYSALVASLVLGFSLSSGASGQCRYQPELESLKVNWTGYKFTEKAPVSGWFKKSEISFGDPNQETKTSLVEFLKLANVKVTLSSVDSDNWSRDRNLKKAFFAVWDSGDFATGKLQDLKAKDDNSGVGNLSLMVGGITKNVPVKYQMDAAGLVTIEGSLDVLDFNGTNAIASINKKCQDLHKGSDGISKTWSTVDIRVTGQVTKLCSRSVGG